MNSSPSQNENNPDAKLALPAGTILGDYRILNTLGQGGFGITYLAELGMGIDKDETMAANLYYDAAQAGYVPAQRNLGKCYQHAKGVPQNLTEAVFWYRKAAAEGHYEAMNDLAICCANGLGCPVNHTEAVHWWQQAAAQGNTLSQYNLGICYEFGQGVSPNRAEAVKWYREAARAGYPDAQSALTRLKESW